MAAGQVIIVQAPDGNAMRDQVVALVDRMKADGDPVEIVSAGDVPDTWDNVVVVFLVTPGAFADAALSAYLMQVYEARLPILPVVENLREFRSDSFPPSFAEIRKLNAKGLQPGDGQSVIDAIRQNLGLESKYRERKVFISYRRVDATEIASAIETYLWSQKCPAFLDTFGIEGGAPVQDVIVEELTDKDCVLFIDSPRAAESVNAARWITEELNTALQKRIPIAVVQSDPRQKHISLVAAQPSVVWDLADSRRFEKVFRLVSRTIGSRSLLDDQMERTLAELAQSHYFELRVDPQDRRRFELIWPDRLIRIEYEDAGVTLERLHRLYSWYNKRPPKKNKQAIYVCGDYLVLPPTRGALTWARRSYPLEVATLQEVVELIAAS
jgi:hypothetical protein